MSRSRRLDTFDRELVFRCEIAQLRAEMDELRTHERRQADRLRELEQRHARLRATLATLQAFGGEPFNAPRIREGS